MALLNMGGASTTVTPYQRKIAVPSGAATSGPTAPTETTVGTIRGKAFAANAEQAFINVIIPTDWVGTSDITIVFHCSPEALDPIADGETIKLDCNYRSIAPGESITNGILATATATRIQVGAGIELEDFAITLTLPFDDANQPLTVGDTIACVLNRDATADTYSGDVIVFRKEFLYMSATLLHEGD